MRYTLELKDKQVKESELVAEAEKVRREKAAEAAGNEQIIAAKAQEEAMKHVLPFKQKQIEQRQLEAEAEKGARLKTVGRREPGSARHWTFARHCTWSTWRNLHQAHRCQTRDARTALRALYLRSGVDRLGPC